MTTTDIAPRDWVDVLHILSEQVPTFDVWAFGSRVKHTAKPYSDLDWASTSEAFRQLIEHDKVVVQSATPGWRLTFPQLCRYIPRRIGLTPRPWRTLNARE